MLTLERVDQKSMEKFLHKNFDAKLNESYIIHHKKKSSSIELEWIFLSLSFFSNQYGCNG